MHELVVGQDGQGGGHADAVVCAEGRSLGLHPFAVDNGLDGVVLEVESGMVALANHVHVSLENHRRGVLMAGGGGLAENHVADFVGFGLDAVFLGEIEDVLTDFLLFLGRAGNLRDLVEDFKHLFGLKVFNFHWLTFKISLGFENSVKCRVSIRLSYKIKMKFGQKLP